MSTEKLDLTKMVGIDIMQQMIEEITPGYVLFSFRAALELLKDKEGISEYKRETYTLLAKCLRDIESMGSII